MSSLPKLNDDIVVASTLGRILPDIKKLPESNSSLEVSSKVKESNADNEVEVPALFVTTPKGAVGLIAEDPGAPEIPEEPEVPLVPDKPDVPEEPLVPDEPLVPELPEVPEEPEVPLVPDEPDVPEEPLVPDEPLVPEIPEVPGLPRGPKLITSTILVYSSCITKFVWGNSIITDLLHLLSVIVILLFWSIRII